MEDIKNNVQVTRSTRIVGFDFAKGVAVLGMFLMNFKIVMVSDNPNPKWLFNLASFFEGKFGVMFVILAGVGLSLFIRRAVESSDKAKIKSIKQTLYKRSLFLFVFGLLFSFVWPADILHFYGIYIVIGALLLTRSWKVISGGIISAVLFSFILMFLLNWEKGWDFSTLYYNDFWTIRGFIRNLVFNGFHPVLPWIAFLLIGILVGRYDIRDKSNRRRCILMFLGIAVVTEIISVLLISITEASSLSDISVVFTAAALPAFPLFVIAGAAEALLMIFICVEIAEKVKGSALIKAIAQTGQMVLTHYVMHVIIGMGLLYVVNRLLDQTLLFSLVFATVYFIVSIAFSVAWLKKHKRGPLEGLMRKIAG